MRLRLQSDRALDVVIARSEATKQSIVAAALVVDCFAALAMTVLKPFWLFES